MVKVVARCLRNPRMSWLLTFVLHDEDLSWELVTVAAGEMAEQLRPLATLPEDLGLVPITHMATYISL